MGWFRKDKPQEPSIFDVARAELEAEAIANAAISVQEEAVTADEASPPPWPEGRYEGRLTSVPESDETAAGVVAAEGEWAGYHVRWAGNGEYVFVEEGGLTHNQVHHQRFVGVGSSSASDPHHYEAQPGDAHYDESAPRKTFARSIPDREAPYQTSHTISDSEAV